MAVCIPSALTLRANALFSVLQLLLCVHLSAEIMVSLEI